MSRTINQAAELIRKRSALTPALAIVLGSGFQSVADSVDVSTRIPFHRLPGFPSLGTAGHRAELVIGRIASVPVAILCGRAHFYEGYEMGEVTFPIRALADWGIDTVLLTNAAGGINRRFHPGDFVQLTDHINFMGTNPLRGDTDRGSTKFVDLTAVYDAELNRLLRRAARKARVRLHPGIYAAVSGPSYETPAEIRAFGRLGADVVGMSTVPEAIVARQRGLRVAAVSCVTNLAAGRNSRPLSHEEVLAMGHQVERRASALLVHFVKLFDETRRSKLGSER